MYPKFYASFCLICWLSVTNPTALYAQQHDFLHDQYDALHQSAEQEKFRKLAPMPAGVVYIQRPGEGEEDMRWHFRTMKELGFTALKQILATPDWTIEEIQSIALEEGIIPWWYGEGGWEPVSDALLRQLKISPKLSMEEIRNHPQMQAYQKNVLKDRIQKTIAYAKNSETGEAIKSSSTAFDPTVGARGLELTEKGEKLFVDWVKDQYQTVEKVNQAYNQHHANLQPAGGKPFASWEDFSSRWQQYNHREYRIKRDILRFKADHGLQNIRSIVDNYKAFDPNAPFRGGGELGLFLPQSWYGVDLQGIAEVMKDAGSFYPSIHFSWHFGQVSNELVRPFYMQSSFANDLFKGGWSGAWECTGGPQQFDGEKTGQDKGFYVDEGTLTQFFLSQIAAGFKGFGIWCWSTRSAGKEAGEYSLLDRNNQVTPRAIKVGKIGQAMQKYRDELWQAHKEPLVGVFYDWDNEGIWAAMSIRGRDSFRMYPIEARIGLSRALINANVPFEYVTADDLRNGLAMRYPVIYLPGVLAVSKDMLEMLKSYVQQGGRLVMDMPSAWYDTYAELMDTGKGSLVEQIFGVTIDDYQFSGINRSFQINGNDIKGSFAHMTPTTAKVLAQFNHGKPAITENTLGRGTAVVLGYAASHMCYQPGQDRVEPLLVQHTLGKTAPPYRCDGALVYRLAAPKADHYFLVNDGPALSVKLETKGYTYTSATDAITGEKLELGKDIALEPYNGRWLRLEK